MKIKPLPGMSLIELDAPENRSVGGVDLPDYTLSAEDHQQRSHNPTPPPGVTGVVKAIGQWPKLKNGKVNMPEFGVGQRVVIRSTSGQEMHYSYGKRIKTVENQDVLAVIL